MTDANMDYARSQIAEGSHHIPAHMVDGVERYVLRGVPPGTFMRHILANDFMAAAGHADDPNRAALFGWCMFLYNYVPNGCYGSVEKVNDWISRGGLAGGVS